MAILLYSSNTMVKNWRKDRVAMSPNQVRLCGEHIYQCDECSDGFGEPCFHLNPETDPECVSIVSGIVGTEVMF